MPSLSDLKNSYKFQKQAKKIQAELKNIHVEAEALGVKVVVSAGLDIVSIDIAPDAPMDRLPALLVDALNRALKKAQIVSAERMQALMSQMGTLPGA